MSGSCPPSPLVLASAKLPRTGLGVLTNKDLPCCFTFGPFTDLGWERRYTNGKLAILSDGEEIGNLHENDTNAPASSNWMRYINCPRNAGEVNLVAFQHRINIYYLTIKRIMEGSELMCYWKNGIRELPSLLTDHDFKEGVFGPGKVVCFADFLVNTVQATCSSAMGTSNFSSNSPASEAPVSITDEKNNEFIDIVNVKVENFPDANSTDEFCGDEIPAKSFAEGASKNKNVLQLDLPKFGRLNESLKNTTEKADSNDSQEKACSENLTQLTRTHVDILLRCDHCDYSTAQLRNLKTHMRKHTGDLLQCELCDYKSAHISDMKKHMRKHTGELLKCQQCGYKTARSGHFTAHMRKHTGDLLHCEHCDYKTAHIGDLKRHMRKHTGELLQCEQCDFRTAQSGNLKIHMRKHTGELLQCEQCDYRTAQLGHLKAHMRKHTGELLECEQCEYKTAYTVDLKSHMRKHTGELLQCHQCDYKTARADSLKRHMRRHKDSK